MLARLGYCADVAADGAEALEAMRRQRYDLLLTDLQMPEIDGIEVARRIVREWGAERPGIIALTAEAMSGDRERCLEAGMDDYISKPVRIEDLQAALIRWGMSRNGLTLPPTRRMTETRIESAGGRASCAPPDLSVLLELRELQANGDPDIVCELIELFLHDTPPRLAVLRRALDEADTHSLQRGAHTLQGSCLTVGARRMASICAELEAGSQNSGALLAQLEEEYGRFQQQLEAFVATEPETF
jgi:CheY-like chemotaxis protein